MAYNALVAAARQVVLQHPVIGAHVIQHRSDKRAHGRRLTFRLVGLYPTKAQIAEVSQRIQDTGARLIGTRLEDAKSVHGAGFYRTLVVELRV